MKAAQFLARLIVDELTPLVHEAQLTANELRKLNSDLETKIIDLKALVKQIPPGTQSIPGADIKILENALSNKLQSIIANNNSTVIPAHQIPHHVYALAAALIFFLGLLFGLMF